MPLDIVVFASVRELLESKDYQNVHGNPVAFLRNDCFAKICDQLPAQASFEQAGSAALAVLASYLPAFTPPDEAVDDLSAALSAIQTQSDVKDCAHWALEMAVAMAVGWSPPLNKCNCLPQMDELRTVALQWLQAVARGYAERAKRSLDNHIVPGSECYHAMNFLTLGHDALQTFMLETCSCWRVSREESNEEPEEELVERLEKQIAQARLASPDPAKYNRHLSNLGKAFDKCSRKHHFETWDPTYARGEERKSKGHREDLWRFVANALIGSYADEKGQHHQVLEGSFSGSILNYHLRLEGCPTVARSLLTFWCDYAECGGPRFPCDREYCPIRDVTNEHRNHLWFCSPNRLMVDGATTAHRFWLCKQDARHNPPEGFVRTCPEGKAINLVSNDRGSCPLCNTLRPESVQTSTVHVWLERTPIFSEFAEDSFSKLAEDSFPEILFWETGEKFFRENPRTPGFRDAAEYCKIMRLAAITRTQPTPGAFQILDPAAKKRFRFICEGLTELEMDLRAEFATSPTPPKAFVENVRARLREKFTES